MTWTDDRLFVRLVNRLIEIEGGYVHNPDDPGGETKYGISRKSFPDLDIRGLTREAACAIYYDQYWEPFGWDRLGEAMAERLFFLSVHTGAQSAVKVLQRAIRSAHGVRLKEDGVLGPRTAFYAQRAYGPALLSSWRSEQAAHYRELIARNPRLGTFARGWLNRAYEDSVTD